MEFNFDDALFPAEKISTKENKLTSYNAKICSSLWFEDATSDCDETEITQLKFSADYHYAAGRWEKALEKYQLLLEMLPPSGMCMRRDVLESVSRCHLSLNQDTEALSMAKQLSDQATNEDHEGQALALLHRIHNKMGNCKENIPVLQELLTSHPQYYLYWLHLAEVFEDLKSIDKTSPDHDHQYLLKAFTCYLRAMLLLQFSKKTSGSFIKSHQLSLAQQVTEKVEKLRFSPSEKEKALKFLSHDLPREWPTQCEMQCEPESASSVKVMNKDIPFDLRWFSWMKATKTTPT